MNRKPYVRQVSPTRWYLGRRRDIHHMLNEVSSLFIGGYALFMLWGLKALSEGELAYAGFLEALGSPLSLALHWLVLAFTLLHSVSWFTATPKAMPLQVGEAFVPGYLIVAGHYAGWAAASLLILYFSGVIGHG